MSYQPYDRNPSGIVFFGTNPTDQVFESNANFTIDGTTLVATNLKISNGGNIGSASDADAISIASNGDVTMTQDLTVTGDLTVNGTTTTVSTTNTVVSDLLLELGNGTTGSAANDAGIVIERGDDDNAFIGFDESANKFTMGTGSFTGASTGDLTIAAGTLVANLEGDVTGDVTGNADSATALATGRNFSITGEITASAVSFDGTGAVALSASVDATAITGQSEKSGAAASNDVLLIIDSEDSNALKKITRGNLISGLGGFSNFDVAADSGTAETIADGNTLTIAGGDGITTAVGATDTVTVTADLKANGGLVFETSEIAVDLGASAITGTLAIGDGGTGATTASAARTALGLAIGSDVQAYDAALAAIAGLATTDGGVIVGNGSTFVLETGATLRTSLGVDAAGTDNSTPVTLAGSLDYLTLSDQEITVGAIVLSTDVSGQLPVANGGTGASAASGARTNLGLAIGSDVQAYHANLAAIAGMTPSDGYFIVGNGSTFVLENGATARTSLGLGSLATLSSVDTDQLAADAVTGAKIADDSINSEHYVDGSIDTAHIADGQITNAKMANDAIDSAEIADGAVDEVHRTRSVATPSTSVTLSSDINLCTNTITVTMPTGANGKMVTVKNVGTGVVTIAATPNIDGSSGDHILYHQNEVATLVYGNSQWNII